jgi:MazG family protein
VVFHAELASEEGVFDSEDVCAVIVEKLIRRHPHVFGEVKAETPEEVLNNWQAIKAAEKSNQDRVSILDGIPSSLPALMGAMEVSRRAVKAGFEWPDISGVLDKVVEEFGELRVEIETDAPKEKVAAELGDLLFTLVNVGRRIGVDPEDALRGQMERFKRRFRHIERRASEQGRSLESLTLDEMEAFWREAKVEEKKVSV